MIIISIVKYILAGCVLLLITVNACMAEHGLNPTLERMISNAVIQERTPKFDVRALQLTLRRSSGVNDPVKQTKKDVIALVQKASKLGFNVLLVKVNGAIQLKNSPLFTTQWSYSYDDINEIINVARKNGMEVIPEINLLTHQELFIKRINSKLMKNDTDYDPNELEVYSIVFNVLDEIIQIFQPKYVHIGHDEVYGISELRQKKKINQPMLTAGEYLFDTLKLHGYLNKKRIRTMMWADMLLDPRIYGKNYHRSEINGYSGFANIADQLPKDIILCDWHYLSSGPDFPTYVDLQKKGFTVWGAVWKDSNTIRAFSDYVAKYARKNEGMIATTWWPFVAQEKDVIDHIMEISSKAFFN